MRKLSKGEVVIEITPLIPMQSIESLSSNPKSSFYGIEIDDYDCYTGVLSLIVDMDDIEITTVQRQEISTTEAWGQVAVNREQWTEVTSCKWNGYAVINQQQIEDRLNEN